jgi:hypothetical protein
LKTWKRGFPDLQTARTENKFARVLKLRKCLRRESGTADYVIHGLSFAGRQPMPRRRQRRRYSTDLTDNQWSAIADLVPDASPNGRPRRAASRELVNATLYMMRGGQAWRLLPHDFPLADGLLLPPSLAG